MAKIRWRGRRDALAELAKNILTVTFSRWGKILKDDQMAAAMIDRIVH